MNKDHIDNLSSRLRHHTMINNDESEVAVVVLTAKELGELLRVHSLLQNVCDDIEKSGSGFSMSKPVGDNVIEYFRGK